jgi:L-ascorbate metabolism protein UlaG (beta-lactamase superfamily)
LANGEVLLELITSADEFVSIETSADLKQWNGLITFLSTGNRLYTDPSPQGVSSNFYRAKVLEDNQALTGDHLSTSQGEAVIHIIDHASFVISWNGMMIYNDPVGAPTLYEGLPKANLILVSHRHGDHFSNASLDSVRMAGTVIVAPPEVVGRMTAALQSISTSLPNGEITNVLGTTIEAVPAYNDRHTKGEGNSYILTLGDKRLFMSGDTEDVPEMRALTNIDVAFLAMNVPFTMNVTQAATAVREFQPKVIYPYHYRNQDGTFADFNDFKNQVGSDLDIEVRIRDWYGSE